MPESAHEMPCVPRCAMPVSAYRRRRTTSGSRASAPTTSGATDSVSARVTSASPAQTTGASPMPTSPSSVSSSTSTAWSAVAPWPLRRQVDL